MMKSEPFKLALISLKINKLRTVLTILGIVIGVSGVITVVSIVEGLKNTVLKSIQKSGSQVVYVRPIFQGEIPDDEFNKLKDRDLTLEHMRALAQDSAIVDQVTPLYFTANTVKLGSKSASTQSLMTDDTYLDTNGLAISQGRNFVPSDIRFSNKVTILGSSMITKLNIKGNPIGQYVSTDSLSLEIVGVVEEQGGGISGDADDRILIPLTTGMGILSDNQRRQLGFQARVNSRLMADDGAELIEQSLRRIKGLTAGQPSNFKILTPKQIASMTNQIITMITCVAGGMVSIALLVGGVGIMNIMLVSVTERTREIGIRKSVGAKRGDLLFQFLIEASLLCVLGGAAGIVIGMSIGAALNKIFFNKITGVPLWSVLVAFLVPAGIGIVFGLYPAKRASDLNAIDALKYE